MRTILSLVAVSIFIPCSIVVTQQLAPSSVPARSPAPTASTTPEPTSTPSVSAARVSPIPRAQPANLPEAEPPASPRVPAPERESRPQTALKQAEKRWAAAIAAHDEAALQSLVAPDFIGVNDRGKVQSRRRLLAEVKADRDTYTSARNERVEVHMFSPSVGVVVGTFRAKGTRRDGRAFDRTYRFTDTWMRRGGQWQCVASHNMLVSPE